MKINKKNKTINSKIKLAWLASLIVSLAVFNVVRAASISDISESDSATADETQQKIDELNKQAEVYRQIIDLKKKQSESLNNQLSIMDSNIQEVQSQIESYKQQIDDLNRQITRLETRIREEEELMKSQRKMLAELIQAYYQVSQTSLATIYLSDSNIASFMVTKDRISQTGDRIKELVDSVMEIKKELESQRAEIDQKKADLVGTNQKLQDKNSDLQASKQQRETLLAQTKGEEVQYQKLLQRVQQQKQELLDIDQYFAASGLSVNSYPQPSSKYFASTSWYYSQRDPKWGDETIGNTKTLMKSYGCAVTAVAMVFKEHGGSMDPGELSSQPIFSGDLINWPNSWKDPKVALTSNGKSHGNIDWSVVDSQIAKDNPVIVYIGKTKGGGGHYVVIHHKTTDGKYVVHDPYFGPNIYLDTSRALVGAMGVDSSTTINQMIIYN